MLLSFLSPFTESRIQPWTGATYDRQVRQPQLTQSRHSNGPISQVIESLSGWQWALTITISKDLLNLSFCRYSRHFEYCPNFPSRPFTYSYTKLLLLSKSLSLDPIPDLMTWSRAPRPWQNFIARKEVRKPAEQTKRQPLSFLLAPPSPTLSSQQTSCLTEKSEDILPTLASVFIFFSPREIGAFSLPPCSYAFMFLHWY